ncbi:hypothetical protein BDZ85DRAFT_251992 [Elsinoe ampelina]|uniref:Uncharacterized protein n=1 Tax=Elsinoe ampelina TaxID=302913 RepID=A0A6A6G540_9PEZI|nr:hypothetical protein BDZ85DRAFT_251992 [Elsinoe ampelina]
MKTSILVLLFAATLAVAKPDKTGSSSGGGKTTSGPSNTATTGGTSGGGGGGGGSQGSSSTGSFAGSGGNSPPGGFSGPSHDYGANRQGTGPSSSGGSGSPGSQGGGSQASQGSAPPAYNSVGAAPPNIAAAAFDRPLGPNAETMSMTGAERGTTGTNPGQFSSSWPGATPSDKYTPGSMSGGGSSGPSGSAKRRRMVFVA